MLPDILGISVPVELLALAPCTYSGFSAHAETVRQKKLNRQQQQQQETAADDGKMKLSDRQGGRGDDGESQGNDMSSSDIDSVKVSDSCEMSTITSADSDNTQCDSMVNML